MQQTISAFGWSAQRSGPLTHSPLLIGRKGDIGNHLELESENVSRRCAAIEAGNGGYRLEDRGNRKGVFLNGEKVVNKDVAGRRHDYRELSPMG